MTEEPASSYNQKFCTFLEHRLCDTFWLSDNAAIRGFWCDGVDMPYVDHQLTRKHVNDNRKIETKAWLGQSGQEEYTLTIHFGKHALRRYAKGSSLTDCIPNPEPDDWITIDTTTKTLAIYLR